MCNMIYGWITRNRNHIIIWVAAVKTFNTKIGLMLSSDSSQNMLEGKLGHHRNQTLKRFTRIYIISQFASRFQNC